MQGFVFLSSLWPDKENYDHCDYQQENKATTYDWYLL